MTIGKLAAITGVSTDSLRFYEREGLLFPSGRTEAGYRLFDDEAIRRVRFIKKAQGLGFTLAQARQLLEFRRGGDASARDVRDLAAAKIAEFHRKIDEMQKMIETLDHLIEMCPGEGPVSGCPILDHLYPHKAEAPATAKAS